MSDAGSEEEIVIDGIAVTVSRLGEDRFRVTSMGRDLGTLELVTGGSGFVVKRPDGERIKRPSPWGGEVTARFQSRELALRALLAGGIDGSG